MATIQNTYWSEDINPTASSEPKNILKKHADELGNITKNVVQAKITTTIEVDEEANGFIEAPHYTHCFDIFAPVLGYQRFTLFCVQQIIGVDFPLSFFSNYWDKKDECKCGNIEDFNKCLKEILSSRKTADLINSIIAQSS